MKDYRKIYVVKSFNLKTIRKRTKKLVTPIWHNVPEIYVNRCYLVAKEYNTQTKKYIKTIQDIGPAEPYKKLEKTIKQYPDVPYTFSLSFNDLWNISIEDYEEYQRLSNFIEYTRKSINTLHKSVATNEEPANSTDYRDIEFNSIQNLVNQLQNQTFRNRIAKTILDDTFDKTQNYKQQLEEIQEALVEKKRQDKLELLGNQVTETLKDI